MFEVVYLDELAVQEGKKDFAQIIKPRSHAVMPFLPSISFVYKGKKKGSRPVRVYRKESGKLFIIAGPQEIANSNGVSVLQREGAQKC